jgi:hypothetical protein
MFLAKCCKNQGKCRKVTQEQKQKSLLGLKRIAA